MDILILGLISILVILVIILIVIKSQKKIKEKAENQRASDKTQFNGKIKSSKDSLYNLNKLVKNFFKKYLDTKDEMTYEEIAKILKKKRKPIWAEFCNRMDYELYSGKETKKEDVLKLVTQFVQITNEAQSEKKD